MTSEERKAMESINRAFTFREKTAWLVGYRQGRRFEQDRQTEIAFPDLAEGVRIAGPPHRRAP